MTNEQGRPRDARIDAAALDAAAALQRARDSRLGALTTARATELPLLWRQVRGDQDGLRELVTSASEPRTRLRAAVALLANDFRASSASFDGGSTTASSLSQLW